MKIFVEWGRPLALRDGSRQNLIYILDVEKVPESAGVYVFGRRWGKNIEALYVGQGTGSRGIQGRVAEIVPSSDPASRTVIVRVHLNATESLVPGMFGRLAIPLAPEPTLTMPESALIRVGQLTMVEVVRQGSIERRTVQLGRVIEGQYEVLSGLASGETVVLRGMSPTPSVQRNNPDVKRVP